MDGTNLLEHIMMSGFLRYRWWLGFLSHNFFFPNSSEFNLRVPLFHTFFHLVHLAFCVSIFFCTLHFAPCAPSLFLCWPHV
ncbi:hypothetical protein ASPWEDRAFT_236465 [Aspergillus wentii DTO 134E9]|uniref:Uncharacterized protein n=1 Tax=Aspergillus wentii DTO 134E9 TaxID=1073089 RepID=A0A1L9S177_ASPWE|nr:uncharacterized protein ASPWEDRAFT_236465 [Aspergillus wentii DTO 134E9]OJJ40884.1 hypothetical protein ASPWEDRAFT_236465 [Aspergillus wentii DTO 134E9]